METEKRKYELKEKTKKRKFVEKFGLTIADYIPYVSWLNYVYLEDSGEEWVDIFFDGGAHCAFCVTATSIAMIGLQIMENVMHADYSQNATYEKMRREYDRKKKEANKC